MVKDDIDGVVGFIDLGDVCDVVVVDIAKQRDLIYD